MTLTRTVMSSAMKPPFQERETGLLLAMIVIPRMMAMHVGMIPWMEPIMMVIVLVTVPP
ncbi:protein of unknown function [Paenibacillus alvei]|uniref:Uncharacterized protein n=1 Tax=Paenibacillus alvei TaxID=44250 RepID=A0A383RBF0_PAEAL|nr:protein of unknown function [Paenibacillus alvei]